MSDLADLLAKAWRNRAIYGKKDIANPITGRQSSNVEVVQGFPSMPVEEQQAIMEAYEHGENVGGIVGTFDTHDPTWMMPHPGRVAQVPSPVAPINPGSGGATRMASMRTSPPPGWMPPGPPPDSLRLQPGPTGQWSHNYPTNYGFSDRWRPGYRLWSR